MLKKYGPFWGALLALVALFIFAENALAPNFQSCVSQHPASHGNEKTQQKGRIVFKIVIAESVCTLQLIDRHNGFFAALAAFAIAGFTFTLWRSTDKLWRAGQDQLRHAKEEAFATAMSRLKEESRLQEQTGIALQSVQAAQTSNEIMRLSAERQLRAYIFVDEAKFERDSEERWAIHITLKNSGQTPAYDVKATVERGFSAPRNEAGTFPLTDEADIFPTFTFGAQSPHTVRLPCDEPPSDIPTGLNGWYAISQSDMRAYLWGRIDYVTFEKPQWTTFQMVNHFGNVANFSFCAVGNDSSRQ